MAHRTFSIVLPGKALEHTVVFLLDSAPVSTSSNILCHSGQTKYCNTENRGLVGKKKAGTEKHVSVLGVKKELYPLIYVCFRKR